MSHICSSSSLFLCFSLFFSLFLCFSLPLLQGGHLESNIKLIPYLLQLAIHLFTNEQYQKRTEYASRVSGYKALAPAEWAAMEKKANTQVG